MKALFLSVLIFLSSSPKEQIKDDFFEVVLRDLNSLLEKDNIINTYLCNNGPYGKVQFLTDGSLCVNSDLVKFGFEGCSQPVIGDRRKIWLFEAGGMFKDYQIMKVKNIDSTLLSKYFKHSTFSNYLKSKNNEATFLNFHRPFTTSNRVWVELRLMTKINTRSLNLMLVYDKNLTLLHILRTHTDLIRLPEVFCSKKDQANFYKYKFPNSNWELNKLKK